MPFINGRFYANPAHGRALETARAAEAASQDRAPSQHEQHDEGDHWVTINGRHVLLQGTQVRQPRHLSARDKAYLDKYYDAVAALAKVYNVDPALILGVGAESGFATQGTYLRTGDAFGMTGGSTKNMTTAASPTENVKQFFDNYGEQIRGTGDNASAFMNGLQGRDASGRRVKGWKVYNSDRPVQWRELMDKGVHEMSRAVPIYLSQRPKDPAH
ncbi:MAG: hypothetical protein WBP79_11100 [Candidatus Acidiferrales bacterium]